MESAATVSNDLDSKEACSESTIEVAAVKTKELQADKQHNRVSEPEATLSSEDNTESSKVPSNSPPSSASSSAVPKRKTKTVEEPKAKRPKRTATGGDASQNKSNDNAQINVGNMFQASLAPLLTHEERLKEADQPDKDMLLWAPSDGVDENKMNEYIEIAVGTRHLTLDKALFILRLSNYNLEEATEKMLAHKAVSEEWSDDDAILFRQAFHWFGKNFSKIRQVLPYHSMDSLIAHYYSVKKQWKQKSRIQEREEEAVNEREGSESSDDQSFSIPLRHFSIADSIRKPPTADELLELANSFEKGLCSNCGRFVKTCTEIWICDSNKQLCYTCKLHYETQNDLPDCNYLQGICEEAHRNEPKFPKDLEDITDQFLEMSSAYEGVQSAEKTAKSNDDIEVIEPSLTKCQHALRDLYKELNQTKMISLQQTRQYFGREAMMPDISKYTYLVKDYQKKIRTRRERQRGALIWTDDEKYTACYCFTRYGVNFKAVSEIIGTKTIDMVKGFYLENKVRIDKDIAKFSAKADSTGTERLATLQQELASFHNLEVDPSVAVDDPTLPDAIGPPRNNATEALFS